jgi:hypothetical protein
MARKQHDVAVLGEGNTTVRKTVDTVFLDGLFAVHKLDGRHPFYLVTHTPSGMSVADISGQAARKRAVAAASAFRERVGSVGAGCAFGSLPSPEEVAVLREAHAAIVPPR